VALPHKMSMQDKIREKVNEEGPRWGFLQSS